MTKKGNTVRNLSKGWLAALALALSTTAFADFTYPVLILDAANTATLPEAFRTANSPLPPNVQVSKIGLSTLQLAGSAQFSEKQLAQVIQKVHPITVMLFDLRQEDHGFLNGAAISWFGINNRANVNKSGQQVEQDQFQRLSNLQTMPQVTVEQITQLSPDGKIIGATPLTIAVQTIFAESDLARAYNFGYTRFYLTQGQKPSIDQVDKLINTLQALPGQTWIYVHDQTDQGRATIFMTMIDMMRNAKVVSLQDIVKRQYLLGGSDLTRLPAATDPSYPDTADRLNFLKHFYAYCLANKDTNFKLPYSIWFKQEALKDTLKLVPAIKTAAPSATIPNTTSTPPAGAMSATKSAASLE